MHSKKKIILAIETGVEGGSLALFDNRDEIDSWKGTKEISKAEEVLEKISEFLDKNKIGKKDLGLIIVSDGPGSSTGIKIGVSIAKGLSNALDIKHFEVSAFEALFESGDFDKEDKIVVVIPIGKNLIARKIFDGKQMSSLHNSANFEAISSDEFAFELKHIEFDRIIFHRKAFETCEMILKTDLRIEKRSNVVAKNLASSLAEMFLERV